MRPQRNKANEFTASLDSNNNNNNNNNNIYKQREKRVPLSGLGGALISNHKNNNNNQQETIIGPLCNSTHADTYHHLNNKRPAQLYCYSSNCGPVKKQVETTRPLVQVEPSIAPGRGLGAAAQVLPPPSTGSRGELAAELSFSDSCDIENEPKRSGSAQEKRIFVMEGQEQQHQSLLLIPSGAIAIGCNGADLSKRDDCNCDASDYDPHPESLSNLLIRRFKTRRKRRRVENGAQKSNDSHCQALPRRIFTRKIRNASSARASSSKNRLEACSQLFYTLLFLFLSIGFQAIKFRPAEHVQLVHGALLVSSAELNHNNLINNDNNLNSQQTLHNNNHINNNNNNNQRRPPTGGGVPYKTVHVSQVCEWKSNLFVPKSNDIHFAQPFSSPAPPPSSSPPAAWLQQQQQQQQAHQPASASSQQTSRNTYSNWQLESDLIGNANDNQQQQQRQNHNPLVESSIVYESPSLLQSSAGNSNYKPSRPNESNTSNNNNQQLVSNPQANSLGNNYDFSAPVTVERNDEKALVLALPIDFGQQFAGFEPACSIRLVVPENMRILAQVTSRRLKFEYEQPNGSQASQQARTIQAQAQAQASATANSQQNQQSQFQSLAPAPGDSSFFGLPPPPGPAFVWPQPPPTFNNNNNNFQPQQFHRETTLWMNVSQDPFVELDQRTIETEANELAFRFLLERNAHKKFPDTRFQVVVTAFQTLSENSDLSQGQQISTSSGPQQQLICDQQRLISANLACDGYKNCQDGHDEEPHACEMLQRYPSRNTPQENQQQQHQLDQQQANKTTTTTASNADEAAAKSQWTFWPAGWFGSGGAPKKTPPGASQGQTLESGIRNKEQAQDATNNPQWASVTGFLLGALLALVLLIACLLPLCYCLYLCLTDRARLRQFFDLQAMARSRNSSMARQDASSSGAANERPTSRRGFRWPATLSALGGGGGGSGKQAARNGSNSSRQDRRRLAVLQNKLAEERLASEMRRQNADNERRLSALIESSSSSHIAQPVGQQHVPPRLQSILKRPASVQPQGQQQPQQQALLGLQTRPFEPPPDIPERPIRRGALASSLRSRGLSGSRQAAISFPRQQLLQQQHQQQARPGQPQQPADQVNFKPTPAQRLTRPTRPVPPPNLGQPQQQQPQQPGQSVELDQRVTTYHFSSASTSFSQAYLDQLPSVPPQQQRQFREVEVGGRGHLIQQQESQQQQPDNGNKKDNNNLTSLI